MGIIVASPSCTKIAMWNFYQRVKKTNWSHVPYHQFSASETIQQHNNLSQNFFKPVHATETYL